MAFTLKPHQKEMLALQTQHDRFMLLAEQGTMKTLPTLTHLSNLLLGGEIEDVLIVSTASGVGAWQRDLAQLSPERQRLLKGAMTLINFDKLSRTDGKWQEKCWKHWGAIVLDESQAIKNPTSNRTKYFVGRGKALGLASKADYIYLLTGTLITNSHLEDAWAPLRCVYQEDWPIVPPEYANMTYKLFKQRYLVTKSLPGSYVEIVVGYRNVAELRALIAACSYRVLAVDVLPDKPQALPDEVIRIPWDTTPNGEPFNKTTKELYEDALDSYVDALDKVMDNPLTRMGIMRQIAAGHVKETDTRAESGARVRGTTYPLNNHKIGAVVERIIRTIDTQGKVVVAYQFAATCKALETALNERGIAYHTLNGKQKDKSIWRRFQADDVPVFIGQYQSAARGIDLFAAHTTLFVEPTDSSEVMDQYRKRTDRNGQTEPCEFVFFLTENSIETDMYAKLADHEDFAEREYREIARMRVQQRGERK